MSTDHHPPPRPLTPIEAAHLRQLLDRVYAYRNHPATAEASRQKAEKERLAQKEAASAARLARFHAAFDAVASRWEPILRKKMWNRVPGAGPGLNELRNEIAEAKAKLPTFDLENMDPERLAAGVSQFLEIRFARFLDPPPEPEDDDARAQAEIEQRRAETARAIIDAGKMRRGELPEGVINLETHRRPK